MATSYIHRLTIVVPAALQASVNTWITANIDPSGGPWLTNALSATGSAPATYYWTNAALTEAQLASIAAEICSLCSVTFPANWSTLTQSQKQAWIASEVASFQSAKGIYLLLDDNVGTWTPPATILGTLGLEVIASGI